MRTYIYYIYVANNVRPLHSLDQFERRTHAAHTHRTICQTPAMLLLLLLRINIVFQDNSLARRLALRRLQTHMGSEISACACVHLDSRASNVLMSLWAPVCVGFTLRPFCGARYCPKTRRAFAPRNSDVPASWSQRDAAALADRIHTHTQI